MCKKPLRVTQMPEADVIYAKSLAADLLSWETRGPGDTANAMRRISTRYGVPYSAQWSLRYRPPKRVWSDILKTLQSAHAAERERQLRKLAHDLAVTAEITGADHPAVVAAQAVLGAADALAAGMDAPALGARAAAGAGGSAGAVSRG
ncbi:hypothetical protein [Methylobacterium sp. ID0610]|uniref:hypothetical protein n=1 Tax=Methylobacterium carpenticola TaxID=3344827 RepID=UPI0036BA97CD